jgi:hypothetical protein
MTLPGLELALIRRTAKVNVLYCSMVSGQLSKWWRTPSAQAAMARAKAKKRAGLDKFLKSHKAKQDKLRRDAENWKVVE